MAHGVDIFKITAWVKLLDLNDTRYKYFAYAMLNTQRQIFLQ
jgi:hypothetical protein